MQVQSKLFREKSYIALHDATLQISLERATTKYVNQRRLSLSEVPDFAALQGQARAIRARALNQLPDLLEQLEEKVLSYGGRVFWARTAADANEYVTQVLQVHDARRVAKSKSMVTEEIGLNHALEAAGAEVVETDLGEYVAQLAGEPPSHIVAPIIHKTKEQVAQIFEQRLGMEPTDDVAAMTAFVRQLLRQEFLQADVGISGVNFAVAETGSIVIVTNEGNGRMVTSAPPVHIAVMGIEKVIASMEDLATLMQILPRSSTGQHMTVYVNLLNGPARPDEPDGPEEFHLVLVDNGRSDILASEYAESLLCIRCGACLNACPVYQEIGGHAYGWVYSGPIGAVVTPLLVGKREAPDLPHASSLCGRCREVCPVQIDIPGMLLKLRRDLVQEGEATLAQRVAFRGWREAMVRPGLFQMGGKFAGFVTRWQAQEGSVRSLPGPFSAWTNTRDFPAFAEKPFRQRWAERQKRRQSGQGDGA